MTQGRRARGIRTERAIRAFRRLGFEVDHTTGSHCVLRHEDGRRAVIPLHSIVKPGLLLNELKKVRISWQAFEDAL